MMQQINISEGVLSEIIREEIRILLTEKTDSRQKNVTIDAPSYKKPKEDTFTVFLAGTIDNDKGSVDWRHKLCKKIEKFSDNGTPLTIFNPRRDSFPKDNKSNEVRKQIRWEHRHLDDVDLIVMNVLENSLSPISLMEMGMYADSGKMVVFCKSGYYQYDNVLMLCRKYRIPLYDTNDIDDILNVILKRSNNKRKRKQVKETIKRMTKELIEEVYAYHFQHSGDKPHTREPYYSDNKFQMKGRDTGHFGSGTYFSTYMFDDEKRMQAYQYGEERPNEPQFIQIDNGVYRVNLNFYRNLYRVRSKKEGATLYTTLQNVNVIYDKVTDGDYDCQRQYQIIRGNCRHLGLKCPPYRELLEMAKAHSSNDDDVRSFSTAFMEYNGYNGVNVSGIYGLDNSTHGSVIYDLSKVGDNIEKADSGDIDSINVEANADDVHNSIAYDIDDDKDWDIKALNGIDNEWARNLGNMDDAQARQLLKNYTYSGKILMRQYMESLNNRTLAWYLRFLYKNWDRIDEPSRRQFVRNEYALNKIIQGGLWYWLNVYPSKNDSPLLNVIKTFEDEYDGNISEFCYDIMCHVKRGLTGSERKVLNNIITEK